MLHFNVAYNVRRCSFVFHFLAELARERFFFSTTYALKQMPSLFTSASSYCLGKYFFYWNYTMFFNTTIVILYNRLTIFISFQIIVLIALQVASRFPFFIVSFVCNCSIWVSIQSSICILRKLNAAIALSIYLSYYYFSLIDCYD